MAVLTFTKSGAKAATQIKLDSNIFGVEVKNYQLLKDAYLANLSGRRANIAKTKKRGEVRGGGRKPWRQKGTGRARAGSTRSPIWRGGGITFGPTGTENYTRRISSQARQKSLRQALSLMAKDGQLLVLEDFSPADNKTKAAAQLLDKIGATGRIIVLVDSPDFALSLRNLPRVSMANSKYINVNNVLDADTLVATKKSLELLGNRLGVGNA